MQDPKLIDELSQQFHVDVKQDVMDRRNNPEEQKEDPQSNKKKSESGLGINPNKQTRISIVFMKAKGKRGKHIQNCKIQLL